MGNVGETLSLGAKAEQNLPDLEQQVLIDISIRVTLVELAPADHVDRSPEGGVRESARSRYTTRTKVRVMS